MLNHVKRKEEDSMERLMVHQRAGGTGDQDRGNTSRGRKEFGLTTRQIRSSKLFHHHRRDGAERTLAKVQSTFCSALKTPILHVSGLIYHHPCLCWEWDPSGGSVGEFGQEREEHTGGNPLPISIPGRPGTE